MRGCNPTPTKADRKRFRTLRELGCIACYLLGHPGTPPDIHHPKQGSHEGTLPLCCWHHRGETPDMSKRAARLIYGPSLKEKQAFIATFGTEEFLLAMVNELIGATP